MYCNLFKIWYYIYVRLIKEVIDMIIKDRANNGQALQIVKEYNELTDDELKILVFKSGEKKEDYSNYFVQYNKRGELLRVSPYKLTEEKFQKILNRDDEHIDLLDSLELLNCNVHSRNYRMAKKRANYAGISDEEIAVARRIAKKKLAIKGRS